MDSALFDNFIDSSAEVDAPLTLIETDVKSALCGALDCCHSSAHRDAYIWFNVGVGVLIIGIAAVLLMFSYYNRDRNRERNRNRSRDRSMHIPNIWVPPVD